MVKLLRFLSCQLRTYGAHLLTPCAGSDTLMSENVCCHKVVDSGFAGVLSLPRLALLDVFGCVKASPIGAPVPGTKPVPRLPSSSVLAVSVVGA